MLRRFSAVANVSLAVAGSAAVLGSQVAGIASGVAPVAYQNNVSTVVSINVVPRAKQGSCVDVRIAVSSDGGQPTGTVNFSIDGTVSDTRAVPASGILNESINCGGAGTAARVLHARTGGGAIENVAYTLSASTGAALSVGTHTLHAAYVPTGNFAPSSKSASIDIVSTSVVVPGSAGFPHGVDAGLASLNQSGSGLEAALIGGGAAIVLAVGATSLYRRRATR